jgi:hypothetical protein
LSRSKHIWVVINLFSVHIQEDVGKEIEDKKAELEPKVVEAYEGSPPEVKALFKDQKPVKVTKKKSAAVTKFLDELEKMGN